MKRNDQRYRKFSASPDDEIAGETCTTRLYEYDLAEVKAMCVDGKKKSDVIRELVRRALYARRYRQAATDPAFKEILKTFDDMVGVRLHHLEERLINRMEADFTANLAVIGYLYLAASFGTAELKHVRLALTGEEVSEEDYHEAWGERFEAAQKRASTTLRGMLDKRRRKLGRADGGDGPGGGDDEDR